MSGTKARALPSIYTHEVIYPAKREKEMICPKEDMEMTKKIIALLLALACVLSLAACGKKNETPDPAPTPGPDPAPTTITAEYTHGFVDMALELP